MTSVSNMRNGEHTWWVELPSLGLVMHIIVQALHIIMQALQTVLFIVGCNNRLY